MRELVPPLDTYLNLKRLSIWEHEFLYEVSSKKKRTFSS